MKTPNVRFSGIVGLSLLVSIGCEEMLVTDEQRFRQCLADGVPGLAADPNGGEAHVDQIVRLCQLAFASDRSQWASLLSETRAFRKLLMSEELEGYT